MEGVARMVLMGVRLVKSIEWRLKLLKKKLNKNFGFKQAERRLQSFQW